MAQADGVVANGTGAAVRSDLNGQLAALFTNHSGSSEPGTTYAYQWWADTNENVLKIRNSSNDGWITLRELDGTMLIEDGSASSPGLAFADDTNTGIFSPAADQIGFATGGAERLEIGSSEVVFNDPSNDVDFRVESNGQTHMLFVDAGNDAVGIGTSTPGDLNSNANDLVVGSGSGHNGMSIYAGSSSNSNIYFADGTSGADEYAGYIQFSHSSDTMKFGIQGNDAVYIDSSKRLLVGDSSSHGNGIAQFNANTDSSTGAGTILLCRGDAATAGQSLGQIKFTNSTGNQAAFITGEADTGWGGSGSSDYPGRLVFSTTADGGSSPTERVRISRNGAVGIGTTSASNRLRIHEGADTPNVVIVTGADESSEFLALGINSGVPCVTAGGVSSTSAQLAFRTADSGTEYEAARFDKDGRLLVGTTSSKSTEGKIQAYTSSGDLNLHIQSDGLASGQAAYLNVNAKKSGGSTSYNAQLGLYKHSGINDVSSYLNLSNQANRFLWNDTGGTLRISEVASHIGTTNGTVIGTQTSDERLKNVGADVAYGLTEVKQLQAKQYALKTDPDTNKLGFIAQQVESIIPEAVFDTNEELDGHQEGDRTKLGMEYVQLIPVLVNAIKELSAEVDTLKTKVAALEAG